MATQYRADLGRAPDPAAASGQALMQAAEHRAAMSRADAEIVKTIFEGAKGMANMWGEYQTSEASVGAKNLAQETLMRHEAANTKEELAVAQQQPETDASRKLISDLQTKLQIYGEAANQGRATPMEFATRAKALVREGIAKAPWAADKIRQAVSSMSGLPSPELFAEHDHIKRMFADKQASGDKMAEKFLTNDIAGMSKMLGKSETEWYAMYQNDQPMFNKYRTDYSDRMRLRANTDQLKAAFENSTTAGDIDANQLKPAIAGLINASVSEQMIQLQNDSAEKFQITINRMLKTGDTTGSAELETEANMWRTKNLEVVEQTLRSSYTMINKASAAGTISPAKVKELREFADQQASVERERWGDKNTYFAQAAILHKYNKESAAKQAQLLDLTLKNVQGFGQDVIRQYMLTPDALKQQNPNAFNLLEKAYGEVLTTGRNLSATNNTLGGIALFQRQIENTGTVPDPKALNMAPEATKAAHEAVMTSAAASLNNTTLTPAQRNVLKAAFDISVSDGANAGKLRDDAQTLKVKLEKADDATKNIVKNAVSTSTTRAITAIRSIKEGLENKYGVQLALSINDAGDILPIKQITDVYTRPELANKENDAMREFREKATPLTLNIVNARYVAEGKDKLTIAREYADVINGKTQYKPFFTLEAMPEQAAEGKGTFGMRPDGTAKDVGFMGVLTDAKGNKVTEYSISSEDVKVNGKEVDFPTIVPTLTKQEVDLMLNDIIPNNKRIPPAIMDKAIDHALKRIDEGKSPFFDSTKEKAAGASKMATMADIAAFAASKKMSIDQAVEGLKAQGYTVGE